MLDAAVRSSLRQRNLHAKMNEWADLSALTGGTIAFITGLVLLTKLHIGTDSLAGAAFGLNRLTWVNLHRFSAAAVLPAIAVHIFLHWRVIVTRLLRTLWGLPGKAKAADLVLYLGFVAVILEGFIAWLIVPGSPSVHGPVNLNYLAPGRHLCIDLHNISGLSLLPAVVIHVRRHIGWITRIMNRWIGGRS